ncbi:MAG: hypothetical protein KDK70_39335 [Myxococcales bacterium]|nr:hypothetical protein [Myxococcales bacterium]
MALHVTDDFTDLVMHVLAHVRMGGAGRSFDARYVAWARERTPAREARWLHEAVEVLDRAWEHRAPAVVHGWPELLGSVADLRAAATQALAELRASQVRDASLLAAVQREPRAELEVLHATLVLLAPWFQPWRAEAVAPRLHAAAQRVAPWLDEAARWLPTLAEARVELAWALGERGRVHAARVVVGAPAPWNGLDARVPAVLAMHEQLVSESTQPGYAAMEWEALTGLAARLHGADTPLAPVHARWLASLELRPIADARRQCGALGPLEHQRLLEDRDGRAGQLAALRSGA